MRLKAEKNRVLPFIIESYNMNNSGTLLICPLCQNKEINEFGTYRSFGSISPMGDIIILRKGQKRTVIKALEFSIECQCGYSIYYKQGLISAGVKPADYPYENNKTLY